MRVHKTYKDQFTKFPTISKTILSYEKGKAWISKPDMGRKSQPERDDMQLEAQVQLEDQRLNGKSRTCFIMFHNLPC